MILTYFLPIIPAGPAPTIITSHDCVLQSASAPVARETATINLLNKSMITKQLLEIKRID